MRSRVSDQHYEAIQRKSGEEKCITKIVETLVVEVLIFMISRAINVSEFISILILIVTVAIIAYSIFNFKISE